MSRAQRTVGFSPISIAMVVPVRDREWGVFLAAPAVYCKLKGHDMLLILGLATWIGSAASDVVANCGKKCLDRRSTRCLQEDANIWLLKMTVARYVQASRECGLGWFQCIIIRTPHWCTYWGAHGRCHHSALRTSFRLVILPALSSKFNSGVTRRLPCR